jgi:hypothetical protein
MQVTGRVPVQGGAATIRMGEGAVWVANPEHDLVQQLDPGMTAQNGAGAPSGCGRLGVGLTRRSPAATPKLTEQYDTAPV